MINKDQSIQKMQAILVHIGNHLFGINISTIRDILFEQKITSVPLAQPEIMGVINLRGKIVTALNMREILGLNAFSDEIRKNHIIIQHKDELFDIVVDKVGEVISFDSSEIQETPIIIDSDWQKMVIGVVKQKDIIVSLINTDTIVSIVSQ
jgi:purine-binding chemotaxis protein CheW